MGRWIGCWRRWWLRPRKRGAGTSLQDTAMSITALTSEDIEQRGFVEMKDYLSRVPGVVYDEGKSWVTIVLIYVDCHWASVKSIPGFT